MKQCTNIYKSCFAVCSPIGKRASEKKNRTNGSSLHRRSYVVKIIQLTLAPLPLWNWLLARDFYQCAHRECSTLIQNIAIATYRIGCHGEYTIEHRKKKQINSINILNNVILVSSQAFTNFMVCISLFGLLVWSSYCEWDDKNELHNKNVRDEFVWLYMRFVFCMGYFF